MTRNPAVIVPAHGIRLRRPVVAEWRSLSVVAGFALLAAAVYFLLPSYQLYDADLTVLAAIGALGLNLITGYAGQASIGTAAFLAIGAFTAAAVHSQAGFIGSVLIGGLAAAFAGLVVGVPSLRVRGLYLIITTLVFQYITQDGLEIVQNKQHALAGYSLGVPHIGGWEIVSSASWYILLLIVLALCAMIAHFLTVAKPGRAWALIREQEIAASIAGINVSRYKVSAFVISSGMIGIAGALGAFFVGQVSYDQYDLNLAISYVAMIIVGGTASIPGSVIGAIVITDLPFVIQHLGANASSGGFISRNVSFIELGLNAVLLIAFLLLEPRGLVHLASRASGLLRRGPHLAPVPPSTGVNSPAPAATGHSAGQDLRDQLEVTPVLRVQQLTVRYHGTKAAVIGAGLEVRPGEIVGIIGPNGAGRTSLLSAVAGLVPARAERLDLRGDSLLRLDAMKRAQQGVVLVPEREKVFPQLTVAEHLTLAASGRGRGRSRQRQRALIDEAVGYFPALEQRMSLRAGHLSGGERQMLALGAALCLEPVVMLIDEMSLGLARGITVQLSRTLRQIANGGLGVLLVEQSVGAVEDLADCIYTMQGGILTSRGRSVGGSEPEPAGHENSGQS